MTPIIVTEGDIGRYVLYYPGYGDPERGRIKSFNTHFVFVVYKCNNDWDNYKDYTGCSTRREDLEYEKEK